VVRPRRPKPTRWRLVWRARFDPGVPGGRWAITPSWGMWAGIWIDGNLADIAPYLQAIAEAAPPTPPPPARSPVAHQHPPLRSAPYPGHPTARKHAVAAVITARSSGHCEIMAPDCGLGVEAIASRIRGRCSQELPDAAAGYGGSAEVVRLRSRA